jgi:hypothetical protein
LEVGGYSLNVYEGLPSSVIIHEGVPSSAVKDEGGRGFSLNY